MVRSIYAFLLPFIFNVTNLGIALCSKVTANFVEMFML